MRALFLIFLCLYPSLIFAKSMTVSRVEFSMSHLNADGELWGGLEIQISKDVIFVTRQREKDFEAPIVSFDTRKYMAVIGPFYPADTKIQLIPSYALRGYRDSFFLLFKLKPEDRFREKSFKEAALSYAVTAKLCTKIVDAKSYRCWYETIKGEKVYKIKREPAAMTAFGEDLKKLQLIYSLSDI